MGKRKGGKGGGGEKNTKSWTIDLTENKGKEGTHTQNCHHHQNQIKMTNKKNVKKRRALTEYEKRRITEDNIIIYVNLSSVIHTILLLRGEGIIFGTGHSAAAGVMVSSMFCAKLLSKLNSGNTYPYGGVDTYGGGHKTFVSLITSVIAFSFNSRSVEKLGGVYLAFVHFMSLP